MHERWVFQHTLHQKSRIQAVVLHLELIKLLSVISEVAQICVDSKTISAGEPWAVCHGGCTVCHMSHVSCSISATVSATTFVMPTLKPILSIYHH
jgi:hypothetical protein